MTDPWRYACPEGHRDVYKRRYEYNKQTPEWDHYYCNTCEETYDGDPVDLKKDGTGIPRVDNEQRNP